MGRRNLGDRGVLTMEDIALDDHDYGWSDESDRDHDKVFNRNDFNLDDYAGLGFTFGGKTIADLDQVVTQIDSGNAINTSGGKITYTFLKEGQDLIGLYNNPDYGFTAGEGLAAFTDAQIAEARDSIALWDDLVAPEFVEKNGRGADIQFANSTDPAQAYAYYPEYYPGNKNGFTKAQGYKFFGDVFVADPSVNGSNAWLDFNGYGATTLIHELGHAIGLSHPGAYNGAGATTYANQAEYAQDTEQYTIMSYWAPNITGANILNWDLLFFGNAQTPMLHDVYVIQQKYGADPTTRVGDTVYGYNSTADRDVFDFSSNSFPNVTIYDAGGEDTLDFSGFFGGTVINLNDGQFSSGAEAPPTAAEVNQNRLDLFEETGVFAPATVTDASLANTLASYQNNSASKIAGDFGWGGVRATAYDNISIAYGTEIENAVGSDYRDIIVTNELDNTLTGGAGSDVFVIQDGGNYLIESFENGGTDTITDFEAGVDILDLSWLGLDGDSIQTEDGNALLIDIDGDGSIDQTVIFENLDYVPQADIFA
ncbi:M10 family metallopeptidase C-terminal domain-containing protein [Aurantiacibacter hainanensis]|uniref:M10 family metallopeptidase C-terminal domain-containing protein n=1 Tax=Aurantiacibacter hainanensis TaxID=3076114 RepID=UPI0030C70180